MRVKSIFILALLFQAISLTGQIKITGKVTEGNEPIVFANVILQSLEGKIIEWGEKCKGGNFNDWKIIDKFEDMGFKIDEGE